MRIIGRQANQVTSAVTSKKLFVFFFLLGTRRECQNSDRLAAESHGLVVVGLILAAKNSNLLVAYPHALVGAGAILAVQGEGRAHH